MSFFDRFKQRLPLYAGGSGESPEDAVIINARDEFSGVRAEHRYLSCRYGPRDVEWTFVKQALTDEMENGRRYDILTIRLDSGEVKEIYFDITQFFGKS